MDSKTIVAAGVGVVLGGLGVYALRELVLNKPPADIEAQAKKVEVVDELYGVTLKRKYVYKYSSTYASEGVSYTHRGAVYVLLRGEDPEAYLDVSFWEDSGAYNAEVGRNSAAPLIVYLQGAEVARFEGVAMDELGYGYIYFEIARLQVSEEMMAAEPILVYR